MARTLFVTPDMTSEVTQCRTLKTPNNAEWLGVFNKALLTMVEPYNWEQINETDLTVEDTIAIVTLILDEFWATEDCGGCMLPGLDTPVFRLGLDGHFQMLDPETNEWGAPSGEYEIPPISPREEATEDERLCAAAANAAHVLFLTYEAITDEIAVGGDALQVAAAMVAVLVSALGGWIAAPVYAIIELTIALFAGMIELLQVLGADVWTPAFDDMLLCALLDCATETDDVVSFDLECIREKLTVVPDLLDPTLFYRYQLFAQILFLMETITVDGLNAAGATTDVASPNCDPCDVWCYVWDRDVDGLDGWTVTVGAQDSQYVYMGRTFTATEVTYIQLEFTTEGVGVGGSSGAAIYKSYLASTPDRISLLAPVNSLLYTDWHGLETMSAASVGIASDSTAAEWFVRRIVMAGNGANPFGENNCVV